MLLLVHEFYYECFSIIINNLNTIINFTYILLIKVIKVKDRHFIFINSSLCIILVYFIVNNVIHNILVSQFKILSNCIKKFSNKTIT